ncbi:uncharacterized protein LOC122711938 [Apis laboriosa]|uniref:uncharacterized protein LOC122711938 n=1 Tax=Apis laboriosa TaxID=183418 RepID=UPI001CC6087D|nr:uncharacterized protein LOC122711938 [Apis laboriosa]
MSIYIITGILVCIMFINSTKKDLTEAKASPERLHIHHRGVYRRFNEIHHLIENNNEENLKNLINLLMFNGSDVMISKNGISIRRKRTHKKIYHIEAEKLQKTALYNYTMEPLGEIFGSWMSQLYHIKCIDANLGMKCNGPNQPHCCIQTYQEVELPEYGMERIYTGYICAHLFSNRINSEIFKIHD